MNHFSQETETRNRGSRFWEQKLTYDDKHKGINVTLTTFKKIFTNKIFAEVGLEPQVLF